MPLESWKVNAGSYGLLNQMAPTFFQFTENVIFAYTCKHAFLRFVEQGYNPRMKKGLSTQPTVFVVDDDKYVRNALSRLFRQEKIHMEAFASAQAFLIGCSPDMPGCLLLDVQMPGMSGLELQAELNARRHVLPVIIMTGAADIAMAVHAMKAGAMDFIEKPFETASLLALIHAAFDRDARQQQALAQHISATQNHSLLTGREREVFDLVVQDKSCKAIASELSISHRTVETHRSRILTKMNAGSLTELMRTANGLRTKH